MVKVSCTEESFTDVALTGLTVPAVNALCGTVASCGSNGLSDGLRQALKSRYSITKEAFPNDLDREQLRRSFFGFIENLEKERMEDILKKYCLS